MSNDYSGWDLKTLKQEIETADISWLEQSARQFDEGTRACSQAAEDFMSQVNALGAAWEGPAATAAVSDAQVTHQKFTQMHSASTASSSASKSYYEQAKADQAKSKSIPNVDDSWGHAVTSGAPGGLIGIGVAKYEQHQKYQQAHTPGRPDRQLDGLRRHRAGRHHARPVVAERPDHRPHAAVEPAAGPGFRRSLGRTSPATTTPDRAAAGPAAGTAHRCPACR